MDKFIGLIFRKHLKDGKDIRHPEIRHIVGRVEGWISIWTNFLLSVMKGWLGLWSGSVSLIADAIHTLSDVSTSIVILIAFRIARKPSDTAHPFGHGRMEAIGTVIVAVLLMVAGIEMLKTSVSRLLNPSPFEASWFLIAMVALTILIKEILARFSQKLAKIIESSALKADAWHHRTDALSSVLVLVALLGQRFFDIYYLDGVAGIAVSAMIAYTGWHIVKDGIDDLLGKRPPVHIVKDIKDMIKAHPEILDVHDLIIHQYGQKSDISFHIEVPENLPLKRAHALSDDIARTINDHFSTHSTVHVDPVNTSDPELQAVRKLIKNDLAKWDQKISFHDLRCLGDKRSKNIVFDLVVDPVMNDREIDNLKNQLLRHIAEQFPSINHITIEIEPRYVL